MKKKWLMAALLLVVAGAALFGVGLATGGLDSVMVEVERRTAEFAPDEVRSLAIEMTSVDVRVEYVEGDRVIVDYFVAERDGVDVEVRDGALVVKQWNSRNWRDWFSFEFSDARWVTVQIPVSLAGLDVFSTSGDIALAGVRVDGDAKVGATSGDIELTGDFGTLDVGTTSGEIDAEICAVAGAADIRSVSGDVAIFGLHAEGALGAGATSGSVEVTESTASDFEIGTTSGEIHAKQVAAQGSAGKITFWSTSGDIVIEEGAGKEISLSSTSGEVKGWLVGSMGDYSITSSTTSGDNSLPEHLTGGSKSLIVSTTSGDIELEFEAE